MKNHILALNVEGHLKNCQLYRIMNEFIAAKGRLPVKRVERVFVKGCHILCIGNCNSNCSNKPFFNEYTNGKGLLRLIVDKSRFQLREQLVLKAFFSFNLQPSQY